MDSKVSARIKSPHVVRVTDEGGAYPGPASGAAGNLGRLLPTQSTPGGLAADAEEVEYVVTRGGGQGTAQWGWKPSGAGDEELHGRRLRRRPVIQPCAVCDNLSARSLPPSGVGDRTLRHRSSVQVSQSDVELQARL